MRGLCALRHEGHAFWELLRETSVQMFHHVFDLHETVDEFDSEHDVSPNDYESSDSEM